jgi:G3E family GTPase
MSARMDIPVTILSGYLGAGKTTLINHLLSAAHGVRIAVLVNDFGSVSIDAALILDTADDTITLANGCACCAIQDDLGAAIEVQLRRERPPQHIVIEASGVAEPARILRHVRNWPGLGPDTVVTMADAEAIRERADNKFVGEVIRRQLAAADLLILNKIDLIDDTTQSDLLDWLAITAPSARTLRAIRGRVDPAIVLGCVGTDSSARIYGLTGGGTAPFFSATVPFPEPVGVGELKAVLSTAAPSIHRVKGFIIDASTAQLVLIQCVGPRRSVVPWFEAATPQPPLALVVIGTDKDDIGVLQEQLASLALPKAVRLDEHKVPEVRPTDSTPDDRSHQQKAG